MLPTACFSTASLPAGRLTSRPFPSKGCASGCRAAISGKISTPSSPRFWKQRWRDCAKPVSSWSRAVADVAALDAAAGFPILLYETVIELERYLAEHDTGLDFVSLMAQVKSPSVKQALARLRGADAVSEATYRESLTKHRPALQETYRRYFRERGVAAMVFPTTPLPAAKIGEDDEVMLNGAPVSTLSTFIRNLAPGSAAGLPGLSLPAGMTKAGLPVGLAIDAPEKSDHELLAIGLALETVLPALPAPPAIAL